MVRQIIMPLESGEIDALSEAAESDLRSIGNQALNWVRTALTDRGLLNADSLVGEDEEEADDMAVDKPIFHPKTFFSDNEMPKLADSQLTEE